MHIRLFLRWFFTSNGVIATAAPPKMFLKIGTIGFGYNSKPFRAYRPNGPLIGDYKFHALTARRIQEHVCQACGVTFWGYRQGRCCGSWSCYKKVFGEKNESR